MGEASFAATDTNDARRPKSLYAKTGTCSDGLDRRRRPYLLLNDASFVESMSCLMRTVACTATWNPPARRSGPTRLV